MIGGADKYMAVCRACFKSPINIPASPRQPLKQVVQNGTATTNGSIHETPHNDDVVVPVKKALFEAPAGASENAPLSK